jgi:hypothetical protein
VDDRRRTVLRAPLATHHTGLPLDIWIPGPGHPSLPYLLVQAADHVASVSLAGELVTGSLSADHLAQLRRWIVLNRHALLDHQAGHTDSVELCRALVQLE